MESQSLSPAETYGHYLRQRCPQLSESAIANRLNSVNWDEPESAVDLNNFAVMALIEAEQCDEASLRAMNVEMAMEALSQGEATHPLCIAHLALMQVMMGDRPSASKLAFLGFLATVPQAEPGYEPLPWGLIYLPRTVNEFDQSIVQALLEAENGGQQALILLSEVLCHAQLIFYNSYGRRLLQLATQVYPQSAHRFLQLGLAHLRQRDWEGLFYLHRARQLQPSAQSTVQALYLAYRATGQETHAAYWQQVGLAQSNGHAAWAALAGDSSFIYVPFNGLQLAVEPSLQSIVTISLLANGDWFEEELAFWRTSLKSGMTVIDVGANVGVYTFSAATAVGPSGRVLAVEPFSYCIQCLQETRQRNHLDWVTICAGAASDRSGKARLSLHESSELNTLIAPTDIAPTDATHDAVAQQPAQAGTTETVDCFSLDSLVEREQLQTVDWLKIDAEGHEMQVLAGSDRLLQNFRPGILYEHEASFGKHNHAVAEWLQAQGYGLYRYRPYLHMLVPIETLSELDGSLNVIALPAEKAPSIFAS